MFGLKVLLLGGVASSLLLASPVQAFDIFGDSCRQAPDSAVCKQKEKQRNQDTNPIVRNVRTVANIIAALTAIGAIIMIMVGALNLITSGGAADQVKKGKDRIVFSLVGVIVVALAWAITRFITDRLLQ